MSDVAAMLLLALTLCVAISSAIRAHGTHFRPILSASASLAVEEEWSRVQLFHLLNRDTRHTAKHNGLNFTWPVKRVVQTNGDIMLGGLMMVHEREDSITCGAIMPQVSLQFAQGSRLWCRRVLRIVASTAKKRHG